MLKRRNWFIFLIGLGALMVSLMTVSVGAEGPTPQDEAKIKRLIQQSINNHPEVLGFLIFEVMVDTIRFSDDGQWAVAKLWFKDTTTDEVQTDNPSLALAQRHHDDWQLVMQADKAWDAWLQRAPTELLSSKEKRQFRIGEARRSSRTFSGYKLPWPSGQTKNLSRSIDHYPKNPEALYAFDFADGTIFDVAAAKQGTVFKAEWGYPNGYTEYYSPKKPNCNKANYLVIKDTSTSPTSYVLYLHLAQNSIPDHLRTTGSEVKQGMIIGKADDTGCSSGHHLHFQVHTDAFWWGQSIDIIFDDVRNCGGRPRTWSEDNSCGKSSYTSGNYGDNTPPQVTITSGPTGCIATNNVTFNWQGSDDRTTNLNFQYKLDGYNNWSGWLKNKTSVVYSNLADKAYTFQVQAQDESYNDSTTINQSFHIDTRPPTNPTTIQTDCNTPNNGWQNSCQRPTFTWSGAIDTGCGGLGDYEYEWAKISNNNRQVIESGNSSSNFTPATPIDEGIYTLRLRTSDSLGNTAEWADMFILKYDHTLPTATMQINSGAETVNQIGVSLNTMVGDNLSEVAYIRSSNNNLTWSAWQPYTETITHTLPALDKITHTVYIQVQDYAGNNSTVVTDTIYLDLYPTIPHSDNFQRCGSLLNPAGRSELTSSRFQLSYAMGEPAIAQSSSSNFQLQAGLLADVVNCLPTTPLVPVTGPPELTHLVLATGGNIRQSSTYRVADTIGQPVTSSATDLSSVNFQLSSGWWGAENGMVPTPRRSLRKMDIVQVSSVRQSPSVTTTTAISSTYPTSRTTRQAEATDFQISINSGADYTTSPLVTLTLEAPNMTEMRLSNNSTYQDENWQPYTLTTTWSLSDTENVRPRYVYAWFKDRQGHVFGTYFNDIVYDSVGPEGLFGILGSDVETDTVMLYLDAWDTNSGAFEVALSSSPSMTPATWMPITDTIEWPWNGQPIYAQFHDRAGSVSTVYNSHTPDEAINGLALSKLQAGDVVSFTATIESGNNVFYSWDFGDTETTISYEKFITHSYLSAGNYTVVVTASNSTNAETAQTSLTITTTTTPTPTQTEPIVGLMALNSSPTYLSQPTMLTATVISGSNVTYQWAFGDNTTGKGETILHTYPATGTYTALVTASNTASLLTSTTIITILPPLEPDEPISGLTAYNDSPTHLGEPTSLTATVTAGKNILYRWELGNGTVQFGPMIQYTYPTTGTYTALVTAYNSISLLTDTTSITIYENIPSIDKPTIYLPILRKQ